MKILCWEKYAPPSSNNHKLLLSLQRGMSPHGPLWQHIDRLNLMWIVEGIIFVVSSECSGCILPGIQHFTTVHAFLYILTFSIPLL